MEFFFKALDVAKTHQLINEKKELYERLVELSNDGLIKGDKSISIKDSLLNCKYEILQNKIIVEKTMDSLNYQMKLQEMQWQNQLREKKLISRIDHAHFQNHIYWIISISLFSMIGLFFIVFKLKAKKTEKIH